MAYSMAMIDAAVLRDMALFRSLSTRRLEQLAAEATLEEYVRGATLFRQGERARSVWLVLSGWVHLLRTPEGVGALTNGSSGVVVFTVTPDELICGVSAVLESDVYRLSGVAGTDCTVIRIPGSFFGELLRHEPHVSYDALRLFATRFQKAAAQYGAVAEPVAHRIVRALLRLREQFGAEIPMTHRELAQMSWTTTESAIRAVRQLKRRGIVTGHRGHLIVRNPQALERVLQELGQASTV